VGRRTYGHFEEELDVLHLPRIDVRFFGRPLHSLIPALSFKQRSHVMSRATTVQCPCTKGNATCRTSCSRQCSVLRSHEGKFWCIWYDMGALGSQRKY
jgi:hypothetical protein